MPLRTVVVTTPKLCGLTGLVSPAITVMLCGASFSQNSIDITGLLIQKTIVTSVRLVSKGEVKMLGSGVASYWTREEGRADNSSSVIP